MLMNKLSITYLKYGVPSVLASKYENLSLSVSSFRKLSIEILKKNYNLDDGEIKSVKAYLKRQTISQEVMQRLLENNNFTCCCCKGVKSDAYIIHHITKYEISQDNSYDNLAVLCPNDHDLAHRGTGLTNSLDAEQIKIAKDNWEQIVKLQKLVAATPTELKTFYLSIPRYQEIYQEIERLRSIIADKKRIANLSLDLLSSEREKNELKLIKITEEKNLLEVQIKSLISRLAQFQPEECSIQYNNSLKSFLSGDIDSALVALDEEKLNTQLQDLVDTQNTIEERIKENIESRLLRAQLLFINGNNEKACRYAGDTLKKCEDLCDKYINILPELARCFERIGTLYFCSNHIDEAEILFCSGLDLCNYLLENEERSVTPLIPDFLHNLGTVYHSRNEFEKAIKYLEDSLEWYLSLNTVFNKFEELPKNILSNEIIRNYINLSITFQSIGLPHKALEAINKVDELQNIKEKSDFQVDLKSKYLSSKAGILLMLGKEDEANQNLKEMISVLEIQAESYPLKYTRELVNLYLEMCASLTQSNLKDIEMMTTYCRLAMQKSRQLISLEPDGDLSPRVYAIMYNILNNLNKGTLDTSDQKYMEEAIQIVDNLTSEQGNEQILQVIKIFQPLISKNYE